MEGPHFEFMDVCISELIDSMFHINEEELHEGKLLNPSDSTHSFMFHSPPAPSPSPHPPPLTPPLTPPSSAHHPLHF